MTENFEKRLIFFQNPFFIITILSSTKKYNFKNKPINSDLLTSI